MIEHDDALAELVGEAWRLHRDWWNPDRNPSVRVGRRLGTPFAKRALENGRQITWLSRRLGHSSLSVTTEIYGHFERAERKREVAMIQGVFGV